MRGPIYAPDKPTRIHRTASACVFVLWIVLASLAGGLESALRVFLFFLLPLFCIWFPDAMASYTGVLLGRGRYIDQPSHPTFLRYAGWFVLLVPLILLLIYFTPFL